MAEAERNHALGGYDDEFVDAIEDELHCPICQLPLKEAVQTGVCGHRFCRQCLDGHFARQERDGEPLSCPVDRNNLIRDKDIFPDKATQRKILSFTIKCPSEGCEWNGELRSKDDHLTSCPLKVVACTNENCHVTLSRKDLQEHVIITCPWRIVPCSHCSVSHAACHTETHKTECKRFPLSCPCGDVIPREEILAHVAKDCILTVISCPYALIGCTKKITRKEVESHFQSDMRMHLDLACIKLSNTQQELCNTQEMTRKLEDKISILESKYQQCKEVTYTWKIRGLTHILGARRVRSFIESNPFYTSKYGYKCRLDVHSNGVGLRRSIQLLVYFVIMKGEYDAILPWPFQKRLTVTLIDQQDVINDRKNVVQTMLPVSNHNLGEICIMSVPYDKLMERRYIVDDTAFIQLEVESS